MLLRLQGIRVVYHPGLLAGGITTPCVRPTGTQNTITNTTPTQESLDLTVITRSCERFKMPPNTPHGGRGKDGGSSRATASKSKSRIPQLPHT